MKNSKTVKEREKPMEMAGYNAVEAGQIVMHASWKLYKDLEISWNLGELFKVIV